MSKAAKIREALKAVSPGGLTYAQLADKTGISGKSLGPNITSFKQRGEVAMVIRFINTEIPSMEALGVPQVLKKIVMAQRGLMLLIDQALEYGCRFLLFFLTHPIPGLEVNPALCIENEQSQSILSQLPGVNRRAVLVQHQR